MPRTFEKNKNAEKLGIDTSKKFIIIGTGKINSSLKRGDILIIAKDDHSSCPLFIRISDGKEHHEKWDNLAYAEKIWDNLEVGDVLISENGLNKKEVLGVCGSVVFTTRLGVKKCCFGVDKEELIKDGWNIEGMEEEYEDNLVDEIMDVFNQCFGQGELYLKGNIINVLDKYKNK